jgi:hypothetical protein
MAATKTMEASAMTRNPNRGSIKVYLILLLAMTCASATRAEGSLKTIDNPGGGKIVYGQVEGQSTEAGAMGVVLRALHDRYGDRPQVGKLFQVRGTNSVALFFSLVKRDPANELVAGLIIVAKSAPDHVEAALVTDEAQRFASTVNPMLKTLLSVWNPAIPGGEPNQATAAAPIPPLRQYTLPDRSATLSLPAGWNVLPQSGGGTILAVGPNGEGVILGFPLLAMNSADPRVQQTMRFAQGPGRNTVYAQTLYYPYGRDLAQTFVDLFQTWFEKRGGRAPTLQIIGEESVPAPPPMRCAHLTGQIDSHDGRGVKEMNTVFCSGPLAPPGSYMNVVYQTAVPVALADRERALMGAILASFSVDVRVVQGQIAAIAGPEIDRIHEIGSQAARQAAAAHAMNDRYNRSVEERWDSQDRRNQAFSNYLLDQTVIQDNSLHGHATVWNQTADSLVANHPQRYQYVDDSNFWKGIDY